MQAVPEKVVLPPEAGLRLEEANMTPQERGGEEVARKAADDNFAAEERDEGRVQSAEVDRSGQAKWQEDLAARYREML